MAKNRDGLEAGKEVTFEQWLALRGRLISDAKAPPKQKPVAASKTSEV